MPNLGPEFWVATWEETALWWHTRALEWHGAALNRLHSRQHARVRAWTSPAGSVVASRRVPHQPGPVDDDLAS